MFRRNVLSSSSGSKSKPRKKPGRSRGQAACFSACHLLSRLVFCLAYSSILKMEAVCSSETSVEFQRTTRRYIPEDRTLNNHRCWNLTSHVLAFRWLFGLPFHSEDVVSQKRRSASAEQHGFTCQRPVTAVTPVRQSVFIYTVTSMHIVHFSPEAE
jgi:hypothetical protein